VTLAAVSNLPPMHEDYALFADAFHIRDHKFFNEQWFVSVLQKLYLNAVTVIHNNNHVGDGLYLLSSFYNHSCVPNTRVEFNGNEMRVFAARNIAPGRNLLSLSRTTSLFSSSLSKQDRRFSGLTFRLPKKKCTRFR